MSKKDYKKLGGTPGVYKHLPSGNYMARKKVEKKFYQETFVSLFEAKQWRKHFNGSFVDCNNSDYSTLKEVWTVMQKFHFPTLATSTKSIWKRRYESWKSIEHLPMDKITPSKVTSWVNSLVEYYKSDYYESSGRGKAGRCNLNNELNLFVTIFNWYKQSEQFEKEALTLTCPIKRKHRKLGFIKPIPDKKKQISLDDAFLFFEALKPFYKDVALLQFYCASRISEIAGLQWSNIDLKNRRMLIKHTCVWDMTHKTFVMLKPFPKNRESRACFITDEIFEILSRRKAFKIKGNDYVFHIDGRPLNYGTIQLNYREAQRKSGVPYSGTHILRHGMAKLARKVGGGLDAVIAMTGHKDLKLADHYSKCDEDDQREVSTLIMEHIRRAKSKNKKGFKDVSKILTFDKDDIKEADNVISLFKYKNGTS